MNIIVKMITRPGCQLCDKQIFVLQRIKEKMKVRVQLIDLTVHKQFSKHAEEIPVIYVNEEQVCTTRVSERAILDKIRELRG